MLDVLPPADVRPPPSGGIGRGTAAASGPLPRPGRGRPRRRLGLWLAVLALAGFTAGGAYWLLTPPTMHVVRAVRGPAVQAAYATGTVEASVMVPIAARTTARLIRLGADEGDQVRKDQLLAQLEDADLQRSIDEAQAEERYARAELARQAALVA